MLSMLLTMEDTPRTTTIVTTLVRLLGMKGQTAMPQQSVGSRSSQASPEQGTMILCRWGGLAVSCSERLCSLAYVSCCLSLWPVSGLLHASCCGTGASCASSHSQ